MNNDNNLQDVALDRLIPFFPWAQMYEDLGYQMPYPEVMMTSDRAYALSTQVSGLLMMQSWEIDNKAAYSLVPVAEATHEAYRLTTAVSLGTIDEAWEVIGMHYERLLGYMHLSLLGWVMHEQLKDRPMRSVPLDLGSWMLVAE